MVIFYRLCIQYLDKKGILTILKFLSFVFLTLLVYGVFQSYGIDPFQSTKEGLKADFATGLIGNPVHFSAYIACLSPLILLWKGKLKLLGYGLVLYLMLLGCSTTMPPATGIITITIVSAYLLFHLNRKAFKYFTVACLIAGVFIVIFKKEFLYDNSRILTIKANLKYFKDYLWFGRGLGSVNVMAKEIVENVSFPFHHLHNEYIQAVIEIGVVGLVIILYGIIDFWKVKVKKDKTVFILKAIFLGFMVQSLTLFPTHLWICSSVIIFVYASLYAIRNKELIWFKH
jgi:O-antigen ligase